MDEEQEIEALFNEETDEEEEEQEHGHKPGADHKHEEHKEEHEHGHKSGVDHKHEEHKEEPEPEHKPGVDHKHEEHKEEHEHGHKDGVDHKHEEHKEEHEHGHKSGVDHKHEEHKEEPEPEPEHKPGVDHKHEEHKEEHDHEHKPGVDHKHEEHKEEPEPEHKPGVDHKHEEHKEEPEPEHKPGVDHKHEEHKEEHEHGHKDGVDHKHEEHKEEHEHGHKSGVDHKHEEHKEEPEPEHKPGVDHKHEEHKEEHDHGHKDGADHKHEEHKEEPEPEHKPGVDHKHEEHKEEHEHGHKDGVDHKHEVHKEEHAHELEDGVDHKHEEHEREHEHEHKDDVHHKHEEHEREHEHEHKPGVDHKHEEHKEEHEHGRKSGVDHKHEEHKEEHAHGRKSGVDHKHEEHKEKHEHGRKSGVEHKYEEHKEEHELGRKSGVEHKYEEHKEEHELGRKSGVDHKHEEHEREHEPEHKPGVDHKHEEHKDEHEHGHKDGVDHKHEEHEREHEHEHKHGVDHKHEEHEEEEMEEMGGNEEEHEEGLEIIVRVEGEDEEEAEEALDVKGSDYSLGSFMNSLQHIPMEEDDDSFEPADDKVHGDEDVVGAEFSMKEQEELIPEDFFYDYDELVSKPLMSEDTYLPTNLLTMHNSFGYDCTKRGNLGSLDTDTLCYIAGNYVVIYDTITQRKVFIQSTGGRSISAISVHPHKQYIAVGENGHKPDINIFEYPSLKLYRILKNGAEKTFSYLDYSMHGSLMVSMAGPPDFMMTLWNWQHQKIVLRCKAFSQDVFRVSFSQEKSNQLTSSGIGHIRFWKMARTFTGLKLQGSLGKFGKKEISDMEGFVDLPDGKIISGCEWGNMLIWDGGFCSTEVTRKQQKPCHVGPIQQIILDAGELTTLGIDGYVRVWDFETTGGTKRDLEATYWEMEPINELKVGRRAQLTSMVRAESPETSKELSLWFAQDSTGSIWRLDLSFQYTSDEPKRLAVFHSGPIYSCGTSPVTNLVATAGNDCTVRIFDYMAKEFICKVKYNTPATSLLWLPTEVDPTGASILVGYEDGVIRLLNFHKKETIDERRPWELTELILKFAMKPHKDQITCIKIDSTATILATASYDGTVFFFDITLDFAPIGFVQAPSSVTYITWSPEHYARKTLLICCAEGEVLEVDVPDLSSCDTSTTYHLSDLPMKTFVFQSKKSEIQHAEEVAQQAEVERLEKEKAEKERQEMIAKGLIIPDEYEQQSNEDWSDDEFSEKKDKEEESTEDAWKPELPDHPSPVLFAVYGKDEGTFWVSMGGFDAGYFYECCFKEDEYSGMSPLRSNFIEGSNDVPINCITFSLNGEYAIMGLQDGSIRIQPILLGDFASLHDYWMMGVHDSLYGDITSLCLSSDGKMLFSVGLDGNFFSFWFEERLESELQLAASIPSPIDLPYVTDITDTQFRSIEEAKQKIETERMMQLAEKKKEGVRKTIAAIREEFQDLIKKNNSLPENVHLHKKEFEMDKCFQDDIEENKLSRIAELNREMEWEEEKWDIQLQKLMARYKDPVDCDRIVVRGMATTYTVQSFRLTKPSKFLLHKLVEIKKKKKDEIAELLRMKEFMERRFQREVLGAKESEESLDNNDGLQLKVQFKGSEGMQKMKALMKMKEKKMKRDQRKKEWAEFLKSRWPESYDDPAAIAAIKDAKENMGDLSLKSADDYHVPESLRLNFEKSKNAVIIHKLTILDEKKRFNLRLLTLRNKKFRYINHLHVLNRQLAKFHAQIPKRLQKAGPSVPQTHPEEAPEKRFEYTHEMLMQFQERLESHPGGKPIPLLQPLQQPAEKSSSSKRSTVQFLPADLTKIDLAIDIEKLMKKDDEFRLLYDQDQVITKMKDIIRNFDADLRSLRHEKFALDVKMKDAELRMIVLHYERLAMKQMQDEEDNLFQIFKARLFDKNDIQETIEDFGDKIENCKKEIEQLGENEILLEKQFLATIPFEHKFTDYLHKVYRKKIKRSKKKMRDSSDDLMETDEDDDDDDDDDDDEEDEEDEDEDEDDENYLDLDSCPPGCEQELYNQTVELREDRLDTLDALTENKKWKETYIKELDIANKKVKAIEQALNSADENLIAYQLKKQKAVNAIDVIVTLHMSQLEYLDHKHEVDSDLAMALVIDENDLNQLHLRIKELLRDRSEQARDKKEARLNHVTLMRNKIKNAHKIDHMKGTTETMLLKKFGRLVNLEKVEQILVHQQLEEQRALFYGITAAAQNELMEYDEQIKQGKCELLQRTKLNTDIMDFLKIYEEEKRQLEQDLDYRQRVMLRGAEVKQQITRDQKDCRDLLPIVKHQCLQLIMLRQEILAMCSKDGNLLAQRSLVSKL